MRRVIASAVIVLIMCIALAVLLNGVLSENWLTEKPLVFIVFAMIAFYCVVLLVLMNVWVPWKDTIVYV